MARKWLKRMAVFLAVILFLITALILFLHTTWGKSIVRNKVEKYLANKLQTTLSFGAIDYRLPNWIRLKEVLILDRKHDTLLSGGNIYVRINMLKLLSQDVQIGGLELEGIAVHLRREANDSTFNYQFITEAFTTDNQEPATTTSRSEPIRLSVHHLLLNDIHFTYSDKNAKQYFSASLGHLYCSPKQLNLGKNIFDIDDLITNRCSVTIIDSAAIINKPLHEKSPGVTYKPDAQKEPDVSLALKTLGLKDISFSYKKPSERLDFNLNLDTMRVDDASLDLANQTAKTKNIFLKNTAINVSVWMHGLTTGQQQPDGDVEPNKNWKIEVDKVALENNSFVYQNMAVPVKKGFDYNHLKAKQINFFATQNTSDENGFNARIDSCSLQLNDQFHLKRLTTSVTYANRLLLIKDLALAINQSRLNTTGDLAWELEPGSQNEHFRCRIDNSVISYADVLSFEPLLSKTLPIALPTSGKLILSGDMAGSLQNLTLKDLKVYSGNRDFQLSGNAKIRNSVGHASLNYTVSISELRVKKQLLSADLLRRLEKENVQLPETLLLTGRVNGTTNTMDADLTLKSEFGQLDIKGAASNINDLDRLKYDLILNTANLETGKWINQDSVLGLLNGKIHLKGMGIQPNKMAALCDLELSSFVINNYTYSNIDLSVELNASAFTAKGAIIDPNLDLLVDIQGKMGDKYPDINGIVTINKADLRALHFSKDSITLSNTLSINATNEGSDRITASLLSENNTIEINGKKIKLDSLLLSACSGMDSSYVTLTSPFLFAKLNTNFSLEQLPGEINFLSTRIDPRNGQRIIIDGNHRMAITASFKQHELLSTIVPDLKLLQPLTISGNFNVSQRDSFLFLRAEAPAIDYGKFHINQLLVAGEGIDSTTSINVTANNIRSGSDTLLQPSISARLKQNLLTVAARVDDSKGEFYAAKASVQLAKDSMIFRLGDPLTINHNKWNVATGNRVLVLREGYIINNLSVDNRRQSITISSEDPNTISPINVSIDSINIGNLMALVSHNDTAIASGILNADVSIQQPVKKFPIFTGTADIKGLKYQNIPVGDFNISSSTSGDSLQLHGSISGNNQANFDGGLHPENGNISAGLHLAKLDMDLVQEFVKDFIVRTSGNVTGDLKFTGNTREPHLAGVIKFDSTTFALKDFQALYKIDGQKVTVDYPKLVFDSFTLSDTLGNKLFVNGTVEINKPGEYGLDLQAETKNFVALSARRLPDSYIYGSAIIDAKIKIGGTSNSPVVAGHGFLHGKSNVHYILKKNNDYTKAGKDGIRFVDIDTLAFATAQPVRTLDTLVRQKSISGLIYNLNLEVSKDAEFSIIIDPSTNDELVLKGEGQLNTGIEEDGSMGITGVYKLQSGYYKMNNQFLKETFVLSPGSTITFNGDPYNAEADVSTQYEVTTSSSGLLNADESEMPGVTKRLPYLVILKVKGPISKPELSFDIKLKKDAISIDGSLKSAIEDELEKLRNDVSAINKQAFSLLVANRFTVTGSGDATASSFNPSTALTNGMSQFLTEAMNEVADDLIKGVDLQVDLKNYKREDNAESKTDIGVSVSKNYFEDRLVVTIGKNFTLGEDATSYQNNMQQYIPDITSTYKLSKDGRYRVKAYQKNEYDTVVEGYFTETGVAFTIELDYNKFKELLQRANKPDNK